MLLKVVKSSSSSPPQNSQEKKIKENLEGSAEPLCFLLSATPSGIFSLGFYGNHITAVCICMELAL